MDHIDSERSKLTRRAALQAGASGIAALLGARPGEAAARTQPWIGYTELRTNLPGGRQPNVTTMRAMRVRADGTGRRRVADALSQEANSWTQFAGWSPDGRAAILGRGWESPENARWEEEHQTFRFTPEGWLLDIYLVDLETSRPENLSAIERVSFYNSGLFFWPGNLRQLGFTALVEGNSHPFRMDRDGKHKRDLTGASKEFAYGFSSSPDGKRIAYHQSYQIHVANADGSHPRRVETGQPFNFGPTWSPDGEWVLFLSGEHYRCHPHLARKDGTGLRKLADRGTYRGVIEFLDVPDYHGGSSDTPVWSRDGRYVYYTAMVDGAVDLHRVSLDGQSERLTRSAPGTLHYHPTPSPDGQRLVYGSRRAGVRRLYVSGLDGTGETLITELPAGFAAMWPHWQPRGEH